MYMNVYVYAYTHICMCCTSFYMEQREEQLNRLRERARLEQVLYPQYSKLNRKTQRDTARGRERAIDRESGSERGREIEMENAIERARAREKWRAGGGFERTEGGAAEPPP